MKCGSKFLSTVSAAALVLALSTGVTATLALVASEVAQAASVSRIEIQGNNRVDDSTIRGNLTISPGETFDTEDIDESVKRLFATGLFSDVRIRVSGNTLLVEVDENLIVNQVVFNGNDKIKDNQLESVVQTRPLGPYNEFIVEADIQAIRDAYSALGRDETTVTTSTVRLEGGRINVAFEIDEGDRTKIRRINFVGNEAYGEGRLLDIITTKRSNFLSFLTRKDIYDPDKLRADEELLRRFYYNHGYADFQVISSVAELDEEKNEYTITITLDEGERYTFGEVNIESSVEGINPDDLRDVISTKEGGVYSAEDVEDSIAAISDQLALAGYPFAQVTPRGDRDFAGQVISVSYVVDQGSRAYIERIEIRGNTRTRDYVIRREFDISEGDAFNQILVQRAQRRLQRLGYFASVNINTAPGSQPDRVVVVVDVQDQPTGEFSIGAGYATGDEGGVTIQASITERNFLGRGQFIRISGGLGADTTDFTLSFTEPYFLGYRLAAGFDIFVTDDRTFDQFDFTQEAGTIRFTAPITQEVSAGISYTLSNTNYDFNDDPDQLSLAYRNALSGDNDPWISSAVSFTLTMDTIDNRASPREGIFIRGNTELAGLGGDAEFAKFTARASYYRPLNDSLDLIGLVRVGAGYLAETSGSVRVVDQFFIGGETIRGFDIRGIGPRVQRFDQNGNRLYNDPLGGTTYFNGTLEAEFPFPSLPRDLGLRAAVFLDAATLYGSALSSNDFAPDEVVVGDSSQLRSSIGASLIWASPFGPLRLNYAYPLKRESFDRIQEFRFGASTRF